MARTAKHACLSALRATEMPAGQEELVDADLGTSLKPESSPTKDYLRALALHL